MTAKSDLVLYDRHGQLAALVIIKNKRGTTRDWATQFRRNILASEALPPVPFLLIVTPDRLYLWRGAGNEPVLVPPTYEGDPSPMIEPYFRRSRVDPGQVSSLVFDTLARRHRQRTLMKDELDRELRQLARTATLRQQLESFQDITSLLIDSAEEEARRLMEVRSRLLRVAEVIPLDSSICLAAAEHQAQHGFSPQDALIYATVLSHLSRWSPSRSCFLNKDSRGFNDPDILAEMAPQGCKLLTRFDHGLQYILRSIA